MGKCGDDATVLPVPLVCLPQLLPEVPDLISQGLDKLRRSLVGWYVGARRFVRLRRTSAQ